MITIKNSVGNLVKVFAETFEYEAYGQIKELCNSEPYLDSKIRIMPDAHAGKGCTIGTTMTIKDKVTPDLVGVDIGCGMTVVKLKESAIDPVALDRVIRKEIPSGNSVHENSGYKFDFDALDCSAHIDMERASLSIGTLGGGNHFIEVDKSGDGSMYLVIHSGSRNLGVQVCNYYQNRAVKLGETVRKNAIIQDLTEQGREKDIDSVLKQYRKPKENNPFAFLFGEDFEHYIRDMKIVQEYASVNRRIMADILLSCMNLREENSFNTIHNYIDTENMILRKGAVSAQDGEILIIPINMRDGALICRGKGNEDWNFSAPHGAGRLLSRSKAKEQISLDEFTQSMQGVYTTSVGYSTIDEAPQAYKPVNEIISAITDTVDIIEMVRPVYNFKAN